MAACCFLALPVLLHLGRVVLSDPFVSENDIRVSFHSDWAAVVVVKWSFMKPWSFPDRSVEKSLVYWGFKCTLRTPAGQWKYGVEKILGTVNLIFYTSWSKACYNNMHTHKYGEKINWLILSIYAQCNSIMKLKQFIWSSHQPWFHTNIESFIVDCTLWQWRCRSSCERSRLVSERYEF